jgi:phosphopantothenoylcysteine decarboxylase/phosphopantothenate--cysteine ligase
MLKNKILVEITGSIAAYKVGYLISKLVQNGFEVKTVVTESALNFIGKATLEGLTNNHVYCDTFGSNIIMSHISLTKWADLTILVPADANTINKFSAGIADNLITSMFLANDTEKPYLIAPAMNVAMYNHPALQSSLEKLKEWGYIVLPTGEGYLACGDEGKGKLLEPDKIFGYIISNLNQSKSKKRILITYGGTKEKIDNVRYLTNISTGTTGSEIARCFYLKGYDVTLFKTKEVAMPEFDLKTFEYDDYSSLQLKLKKELNKNDYQAVIHLAAISDYSPDNITVGDNTFGLPSNDKINSENDSITITFKRNTKIINHIKSWSLNKTVKLIGFKFANSSDRGKNDKIIDKLFLRSKADYIVFNTFESRINDKQTYYEVIDESSNSIKASNARELAKVLEQLIREE